MCWPLPASKNKKVNNMNVNFDIYWANPPLFFACHNNNLELTIKNAVNTLNFDPNIQFIHVWHMLKMRIFGHLHKICVFEKNMP